MSSYKPPEGQPAIIRRVRVQIGDDWTERSTNRSWSKEDAQAIAMEMVRVLTTA